MIVVDKVLKSWEIYNAEQFKKVFNVEQGRDDGECDEDYIMSHLEADERKFKVIFNENRNSYEEFWRIQEVE